MAQNSPNLKPHPAIRWAGLIGVFVGGGTGMLVEKSTGWGGMWLVLGCAVIGLIVANTIANKMAQSAQSGGGKDGTPPPGSR